MRLHDVISELDDTKPSAELLALLRETVEMARDSTPYTWSGVNNRLAAMGVSLEVITTWGSAVASLPGGDMMERMLSSGGIDFSLDLIQAALSAAKEGANGPTTQLLTLLQAIGVQTGPRWQKFGLPAEPTLQQIDDAKQVIENTRWVTHVVNEILNPGLSEGKTIDELKALVAGS